MNTVTKVGARGDEGALNLTWEQVDWSTGSLLVGKGSKTKKPGRFFFDAVPEVQELLRELRGRNETWVFAHKRNSINCCLRTSWAGSLPVNGLRRDFASPRLARRLCGVQHELVQDVKLVTNGQ